MAFEEWRRKLEADMAALSLQVSEQKKLHKEVVIRMDTMEKILTASHETNVLLAEIISYAKKTYEVFEPIARIGSKIAKFSILFTAVWHGAKWLGAKVGMVS